MKPEAVDRRVQRTRFTLRLALANLMTERPWDQISVIDLCERANIGRSTFYTHFADKEDLLLGGFQDLQSLVRVAQPVEPDGPAFAAFRALAEHAAENRRLFRAIVGKYAGYIVQDGFFQVLVNLVQEEVAALYPAGSHSAATVHYIAGACFGLLFWWLESDSALSPDELYGHLIKLLEPTLSALRAPT